MNRLETKMKMISRVGTLWVAMLYVASNYSWVYAQNEDHPVKTRPAQLTFFYPVGSNGLNSYYFINNFSINMLAGISAGVKGLELGGLGNFNKGHVTGAQAAGLINASTGNVAGLRMAGLVNFNKGYANAIQAAGIINATMGPVKGLQLAGLANTPAKDVIGLQVAGILNTSLGHLNGLQLGLVNVAVKSATGSQIGLVNYTGKLNGFQLGLVNVADSVGKGAGLGLVTYYRNGYHKFEIEWNETFYLNATFKSGVEKFYMIYTVGFKTKNNRTFWAPGIGVGSLFQLSQGLALNADLITSQVNEDEWWTNKLNLLNTLKFNFSFSFTDELAIFAGPSFNVVVSDLEDVEGAVVGDSFSPWDFYDKTRGGSRVKMYIGFNAGIRF
ncbi:hypothetical protein QQ020_20455 [Fulvivirgaceae bacterium BMA12]|uniref:DUF5723 domain-containing protein n=1 Tax=Agaribacillus aureus TaxID=3051825 RepID=A0ABT8L9N6_9BACT|nr:hypothetical protein [Fulvivirgaceae bacterium BMA12]